MPALRGVYKINPSTQENGIWIEPNWLAANNYIGISQGEINTINQQNPYTVRVIVPTNGDEVVLPISIQAANLIQTTIQSRLDTSSLSTMNVASEITVTYNPDTQNISFT